MLKLEAAVLPSRPAISRNEKCLMILLLMSFIKKLEIMRKWSDAILKYLEDNDDHQDYKIIRAKFNRKVLKTC